ncbi:stalk domain-containing protein [Paenibacillus polymyxa]|uniref:stalk domain-containing protein n=1 Tax=Paenibacillus polymyxa TaxID=1406 RepID=UPI002024248C|nr:stalk domain-containing protein [Paenibacillus polymyxa]MDU8675358.1 stalk domain-containing protein [Paenibacillus polymyxa]MDU8700265.1 stalk domain-containing protein [Paenibacillus polymyxa]URJ54882.1 stalk domain-containing protein [Paenibacillus polymyxa]URJ66725.1 stalk domain-containing protein [Paenibacillus polymyxa]URJ69395.1 stalk domain-containing protein [Paenibacillus polymyxa]
MKRKIKTFIFGLGVGILATASVSVGASNFVKATLTPDTKIVVNGQQAKLNDSPINLDGKAYLPLRDVSSAMGYSVKSASSNKIELVQGGGSRSTQSTATTQPTKVDATSTTAVKQGGKIFNVEQYAKGDKLDSEKIAAAIASGELTINSQDAATGKSLLMYVVEKDDYATYQTIHKNALNPNLRDNEGNTALHYAVLTERNFYLGELKGMSADPSLKNKNGLRPVDLVKNNGDKIVLETYMASREAFK